MASETATLPADSGTADTKEAEQKQKESSQSSAQKPTSSQDGGTGAGAGAGAGAQPTSKQLTNAQKKAQQKAEKAARRAQAKAAAPPPPGKDQQQGGPGGGGGDQQHKKKGRTSSTHQPQRPVMVIREKEKKPSIPECFSHLSIARRIPPSQADKDVHPAVLALGQQMSSFALTDSIGRLQATLLALKKVIDSYTTPQGSSFSRHFTPHALNPQIDYLSACRPMCFCMGSAVRWLKLKISKIDPDADDLEAKSRLLDDIDDFLLARIALADESVVEHGADHIPPAGSRILTYGHSRLVESTLRFAHQDQHKHFSLTVLDDPVSPTGRPLATSLAALGIPTTYLPSLSGLDAALAPAGGGGGGGGGGETPAKKILLGAEAMFSNGAMYGRAGSADVALAAAAHGLPVVALCHSFNFTERAATDSLTYNEIDPDRCTEGDFRLLFDTTPHVTDVVTDVGNAPPRSATTVLRRWEDI